MNDDELKQLWRQQPLRKPDVSSQQLISAVHTQTSRLRRALGARDLREMAACVFVVIIFGIFYFTVYRSPVSRFGVLVVIGSSIFIAWKLIHTRRTAAPALSGATVVESLQAELNAVRAQSRLLRSVLWWYLLPLAVGVLLCSWGSPSGVLAGNIGYTIFVIALNVFIYRLNQRARAKQLLPVEAQLESLIRSAETGEPPDESHVENLRPIVLSMQTADHIKPVEFKVAFWQLAIYGVPGIVGIWLVLTLTWTIHNTHWKGNEGAEENHSPSVQYEETNHTNRYFVVARKLVYLLNASDYAAVQKLYNPDMSKVFPPKETTDFYKDIASRYGRIEKFDGPTGHGYQGWTAFRLDFQHGEMKMSLALDADDKISGIYFQPTPISYAYIKANIRPFILHLFSGRHLLWGLLSLVAGLFYTWLIQNTVRRAVGVSTLGIHLKNGMSLILWDEIKEVRPFRFLNIRNLCLISESGGKTIMHWTPLERHSDVRTAVEKFAPANHPIRDHLRLLRTHTRKKDTVLKSILIGMVMISLGAIAIVRSKEAKAPTMEPTDSVSQMLERVRVTHHLPALAAAVVVDGNIVAANAVGFRKNGGSEKVTADDKFHLGSVTKSMTATVAAMLVEQEKISWTTTIEEAFPELRSEMHPDYLRVTLEQLLSHRGGAPHDAPADLWRNAWAASGTSAEQRMAFIKGILARAPEAKPGTKYIYSNQGYTIAGVMLEKTAGKMWEELLRSMLFEPLGMTTSGFGAPASPGTVDQPWGHKALSSGGEPVPPGPGADNPLAISPAGAVHCSLGDLAKYAAFHMAGERGESKLLTAKSFEKLHSAITDNDDYALGWIVLKRPWANGRALMHNGSNTTFYVVVWMAPDKNCAVIVASNIGADDAFQGCDDAAGKLINQYFGK